MGKDILFPYERIREVQNELIEEIKKTIESKGKLIAHAPTGLGKTAAVLSVALKHAIDHNLCVLFLTSRHTQHAIAIQTLKEIKAKFNISFNVVDVIGKKLMCAQPGAEAFTSSTFIEYCKSARENSECDFYNKLKSKGELSQATIDIMRQADDIGPQHNEEFVAMAKGKGICPYEAAMLLAKKSHVIVCDYHYLFNPSIRENFLTRINRSLSELIVVIDEAHNIPSRIRELKTVRLSSIMLKRAIKEARAHGYEKEIEYLNGVQEILLSYSAELVSGKEKLVRKEDFIEKADKSIGYQTLIDSLDSIGAAIRQLKKQSFIGSIASFLEEWREGEDDGFVRIFSVDKGMREQILTLSYRCLDPSVLTKEVIGAVHSTVMLSGTLTPTSMYKDLLGFPDDTAEKTFPSPFSQDNRLNLIIPETTTKYSMRGPEQFKRMAEICSDIVNIVPGNSIVFFPSYYLRDEVDKHFSKLSEKTEFKEQPNMSKNDKQEMLEKFKSYKDSGAVILGTISGSFSEGIDLPGDFLKCVIIVGLPLGQPDLESSELISYFDKKFGRGWDYGYLYPAFNKTMQSAGRCIRSEKDQGIIIFLDERYAWPNYIRCFPHDIELKMSRDYESYIKEFFRFCK